MNHLRKMSLVNFKRLSSTKKCISVLLIETIILAMFFSLYLHHYGTTVVINAKAAERPLLLNDEVPPSPEDVLFPEINGIVKDKKTFYNFEKNTGGKDIAKQEKAKGLEIIANKPKLTLLGKYSLTAYCPCLRCCPTDTGVTASGVIAQSNHTVSFNSLPFGTEVYIQGYGYYVVEDTGGMSGFDIFFDDHQTALDFGRHSANVYIVERPGS